MDRKSDFVEGVYLYFQCLLFLREHQGFWVHRAECHLQEEAKSNSRKSGGQTAGRGGVSQEELESNRKTRGQTEREGGQTGSVGVI